MSHFIGFFHISVENARAREAYTEFAFTKVDIDIKKLPVHTSEFAAPFDLLGFEPGFGYRAPPPEHWYVPTKAVAPEISIAAKSVGFYIGGLSLPNGFTNDASAVANTVRFLSPQIEAPGSVVNHFSQAISLSDDDYFSVGGHGLAYNPKVIDDTAVLEGFEAAAAISPLGTFERPGSGNDMIAVIQSVIDQLETASGDGEAVQVHIRADSIDGIYVNGVAVEETPRLEDYRAFDNAGDEVAEASGSNVWMREDGTAAIKVSVEVEAGGNTLINNVVLQNFWTGAKVTLVGADHIEVNAIVQINALWDADAISPAISNWNGLRPTSRTT